MLLIQIKEIKMKKMITCSVAAFISMIMITSSGIAQGNLKDALTGLAQPVAEKYTKPVVTGFGSNLNTGWFHRSPKAKKFGLDIEFGMIFTGTIFPKEDQHFSHEGQFQLSNEVAESISKKYLEGQAWYGSLDESQKTNALNSVVTQIQNSGAFDVSIAGGTFIGKRSDKLIVTFGEKTFTITDPNNNQQNITLTGMKDTLAIGGITGQPVVPLAAPQATIGTIMGTQITIRYLPPVKMYGSVGKLNYFGWGVQHNPGVWFNDPLPVDLAFAFYQQNISRGKLFEAHAVAYGVTVSKQIGFGFLNITPYAGYLRESSKMKFTYEYMIDETSSVPVKFSAKGINKDRITVGGNFKFLLININADYSFAKKPVYSAGVNFSI